MSFLLTGSSESRTRDLGAVGMKDTIGNVNLGKPILAETQWFMLGCPGERRYARV